VARLLFPEDSQRLIYQPGSGRGKPLANASGTQVLVTTDAAGLIPADILDMDDEEVTDSILVVDASSMLPQFQGPDDATALYATLVGRDTGSWVLNAATPARLDDLDLDYATDAQVGAAVAGHNTDTTDVHGIVDTALLATDADVAAAVGTHAADTTNVHGITDTTVLATDAEVAGAVAAHVAAADPHAQYQKESEKGQNSGYASLDEFGDVPDAQIPSNVTRDVNLAAAVEAHRTDTTNVHGISNTADLVQSGSPLLLPSPVALDDGWIVQVESGLWVAVEPPSNLAIGSEVVGATPLTILSTDGDGNLRDGRIISENSVVNILGQDIDTRWFRHADPVLADLPRMGWLDLEPFLGEGAGLQGTIIAETALPGLYGRHPFRRCSEPGRSGLGSRPLRSWRQRPSGDQCRHPSGLGRTRCLSATQAVGRPNRPDRRRQPPDDGSRR
jgi:hypothetical protein